MLLDLGLDPNGANNEGRTALMGAAMKGRNEVVQLLVERGADLDAARQRQPRHRQGRRRPPPATAGRRSTTPRVSCASACSRRSSIPKTSALIRKLMAERGMPAPPIDRNILSVCVVALCQGTSPG